MNRFLFRNIGSDPSQVGVATMDCFLPESEKGADEDDAEASKLEVCDSISMCLSMTWTRWWVTEGDDVVGSALQRQLLAYALASCPVSGAKESSQSY